MGQFRLVGLHRHCQLVLPRSMAYSTRFWQVAVLSSGALVDASWSLNDPKGPWSDDSRVPAREAASTGGAGDRGWDPCCLWDQDSTLKCSMGPNDKDWGYP